jgi:hypothetical protein
MKRLKNLLQVSLSLKAKLLGSISLLIVASILAASVTAYWIFREDTLQKARERLGWVAQEGIRVLDRTIGDQLATVNLWAGLQAFAAALQYDNYEEADGVCAALVQKNPEVAAVELLDGSLRVKSCNVKERVGQPSRIAARREGPQSGPLEFGGIRQLDGSPEYVYTLTAPIQAGAGLDLGFIAVQFRWSTLLESVWGPKATKSGAGFECYLIEPAFSSEPLNPGCGGTCSERAWSRRASPPPSPARAARPGTSSSGTSRVKPW